MKRYVWLALVIAILVPVAAFACHALLTVSTPSCETVNSSYEFQGTTDGKWYRGVASGDLASFTTDAYRDGAKHTGVIYNGAKPAGTYLQTFKLQVSPNIHTNAVSEVGHCNTPTWYGYVVYKHDGNSANCSLKNEFNFLHQKPWKWDQTVQGAWVVDTPASPASDKPGTFVDYGSPAFEKVTVQACYVVCTQTTTLGKVYGATVDVGLPVWGDWVDNGDGSFSRTGTQATSTPWTQNVVDKFDNSIACPPPITGADPGSRPVEDKRGAKVCEIVTDWRYISSTDPVLNAETLLYEWNDLYQKFDVYNDGGICAEEVRPMTEGYQPCSITYDHKVARDTEVRDMYTGQLCEVIKKPCQENGAGWALFELWSGEDYTGDYATMYVYKDGDGNFPEGVSTSRQACVLGWVAKSDSGPHEIMVDSCTGAYTFKGRTFQPRRDVIKHGVCDRSQPCLVQ